MSFVLFSLHCPDEERKGFGEYLAHSQGEPTTEHVKDFIVVLYKKAQRNRSICSLPFVLSDLSNSVRIFFEIPPACLKSEKSLADA